MNIPRHLIMLICLIHCSLIGLAQKKLKDPPTTAAGKLQKQINEKDSYRSLIEGLPGGADSSMVRIPFEYKQSALFHRFTLEVIDSVITLLQNKKDITLSIDGYAHLDEGTDTICKWLSLNRAFFVRDYVLGRGIDSARLIEVNAYGNTRPFYKGINKKGFILNCRAELRLNYPVPIVKVAPVDTDEDGLPDGEDQCPEEYGYREKNGCPNKDAVIVPFEPEQAVLHSMTYIALDSVITVLKENPSYTIAIEGHAFAEEGNRTKCDQLARERAELVKGYILSRMIYSSRIDSINSLGSQRPLNAGKNSQEIFRNSRVEINFNRH